MTRTPRRRFLHLGLGGVAALAGLAGCAAPGAGAPGRARVLVVGGGYGGATAAKYLRLWSAHTLDVVLVEPEPAFVSCPMSNLVLGGSRSLAELSVPYDALARTHGVRVVRDRVAAIDPARRVARLASGPEIGYDRLVLSPGVEMMWDGIEGLKTAHDEGRVLQAWQAGAETLALRRQLEAMPDGGVFAIAIPEAPYRCPPGPYERACQAAWYFKRAKPRSKVLVLDGNEEVQSKKALFTKAWSEDYKGIVEYRPDCVLTEVDAKTRTARFEIADDVKADVLNVIPPHGAGAIARSAGVITVNDQWCEVEFLTFESKKAPHIHVLGDAIQVAPLMPKSGHMANQHGKVAAAAVLAALAGQRPNPAPVLNNTCYSYITDHDAVHVASVHQYDAKQQTYLTVPGSGGLSAAKNAREGDYGLAWAQSIWADMLG